MNGKKWTDKQVQLLIELYSDCYQVKDLVEVINRSIKSIYQKAKSLNLKRKINVGNKNLEFFGYKSRFIKGQIPWNKGKKGLQIGGKETQFKKGNIPYNTKHFEKPYLAKTKKNNIVSIFWVIQFLGTNKRIIYSRYLWEKINGRIPDKHVVYYINGVDEFAPPKIEDLGLMSMVDNMNRNTIHRYPKGLKKAIKTLSKLNKAIQDETN